MHKMLQCGRGHFDAALKVTLTPSAAASGPLVYGGYAAPAIAGGALNVSVLGHRGMLYALDHLGSLPPAAAAGYVSRTDPVYGDNADFWDPTPPWGEPGQVVRRLRLLLVIPSRVSDAPSGMTPVKTSERLTSLWPTLKALGLTVCMSGRAIARIRPLLAAAPVTTLSVTQTGVDLGVGSTFLATAGCPPADNLPVGCDVMVVELNANRWAFGGMSSAVVDGPRIGYSHETNNPAGAIASTVAYPFTDGVHSALVHPADAAADAAAARALAGRCDRYAHYCYQLDTYSGGGSTPDGHGSVDDAAIYASLYGGLPFVTRRIVTPGDADGLWARVLTDVQAFFA